MDDGRQAANRHPSWLSIVHSRLNAAGMTMGMHTVGDADALPFAFDVHVMCMAGFNVFGLSG